MRTDKDLFGYLYRRLTNEPFYILREDNFKRNNGLFNREGMYANRQPDTCKTLEVYYDYMGETRETFSGINRPDFCRIEFLLFVRIPYVSTDNFTLTDGDSRMTDNIKAVLEESADVVDNNKRLPFEGCTPFQDFKYNREMLTRPSSLHCVYLQYWQCLSYRSMPIYRNVPTAPAESIGINTQLVRTIEEDNA